MQLIVTDGLAEIAACAIAMGLTGINPFKSGAQTLLIGGLVASAAFYLAHLFS